MLKTYLESEIFLPSNSWKEPDLTGLFVQKWEQRGGGADEGGGCLCCVHF